MNSSQPSPLKSFPPSNPPSNPPSTPTDPVALDLTQPGPEHSQLMKWIGTWDVAFTQWTAADEPEKQAKGTSIFTSAYSGRYIREEYASDFAGKPFMGTGTTGYDRAAKHFVTTWHDNMGTGIAHLAGSATREGQEITYHGTMMCAQTQREVHLRHVVSWESSDRFTISMFNRSEGKERKVMELVYSRRA